MQQEQFVKKNGFTIGWQKPATFPQASNAEFNAMRDWQVVAFNLLKAAPHMILNAPMGSGKSWLMCLLSAHKMEGNPALRSIIAVPQTIIAPGFVDANFLMPDGQEIHWHIKHNLCRGERIKGTINYFITWLEQPSNVFADRTILCTHTTLVSVYKKLKAEGRLELFNNLLVWVDEAHHVKNVAVEGFDSVISNNLGAFVSHFLNDSGAKVEIGLTTASFFRGDRASLLTVDMEARFKRFNLPYDEYLKSMKHLRSFSFDFLLSGRNYMKGVELLIKADEGKDIIYIPHTSSQYSTGNKYREVGDIINLYGNVLFATGEGLVVVRGAKRQRKILDLVTEKNRKQKKEYLDDPIVKKRADALDAIVTMGMFKEGANWIFANRSIIIGARSSLVDVVQIVGRLFRDVEGKEHVQVVQVLPFTLDQQDEEHFRENLNDYLKAIYASLILENILNPVKIRSVRNKDIQANDDNTATTNWLDLVTPDETKKLALLANVTEQILEDAGTKLSTSEHYEQYLKKMPSILEANGVKEFHEEVANEIWAIWMRQYSKERKSKCLTAGLSVQDIDFDIVEEAHPLGFLLRYSSGACGINTFKELREAIQSSKIWRPFEDARQFVRSLNLKKWDDWVEWAKTSERPIDIPSSPHNVYAGKGWVDWGDFLGTNTLANQKRKYRIFDETKLFVRSLGLRTEHDWRAWKKNNKLPADVPGKPERTYVRKGWNGWGDFLGTNVIANQHREFLPFAKGRQYVQSLGLKNKEDWAKWSKTAQRPANIPSSPGKAYTKEGWLGWGDFLGTGKIANQEREFRTFEDARLFARSLQLKSKSDWFRWVKTGDKPLDIPAGPSTTYANKGWIGWKDWLGNANKKKLNNLD